jgi:hypothetical protein
MESTDIITSLPELVGSSILFAFAIKAALYSEEKSIKLF